MANVIIIGKDFDWDITVWENDKPVKRAWGYNRGNAIGKAEILAEYYLDDNGQQAGIVINKK